jgi:DNA invertase Pin-like site-specific DNA recombinase
MTKRGVRIEFLKEHLVLSGEDSPMANLMLSVMGAFAEFERICAEAITRATRRIHASLTEALTPKHQSRLDALLDLRENSTVNS